MAAVTTITIDLSMDVQMKDGVQPSEAKCQEIIKLTQDTIRVRLFEQGFLPDDVSVSGWDAERAAVHRIDYYDEA